MIKKTIRDHAENHGVFRFDMRAESTGKHHLIHMIDIDFIHQQTEPGI